jgi:hypothetical protein
MVSRLVVASLFGLSSLFVGPSGAFADSANKAADPSTTIVEPHRSSGAPVSVSDPRVTKYLQTSLENNPVLVAFKDRYPQLWKDDVLDLVDYWRRQPPSSPWPPTFGNYKLQVWASLSARTDEQLDEAFAIWIDKLQFLSSNKPSDCAAFLRSELDASYQFSDELKARQLKLSLESMRKNNATAPPLPDPEFVKELFSQIHASLMPSTRDALALMLNKQSALTAEEQSALCDATLARETVVSALPKRSRHAISRWRLHERRIHPRRGTSVITAIASGQGLLLQGATSQGLGTLTANAFKENPSVRFIALDSPGGDRGGSLELARHIARGNLDTVVFRTCTSACATAFLHGRKKSVARNAKLGFHDYGFSERFELPMSYYQRMLPMAPEWFLKKWRATEHKSMWYPTESELRSIDVKTVSVAQTHENLDRIVQASAKTNGLIDAVAPLMNDTFFKSEREALAQAITLGVPDNIVADYLHAIARRFVRSKRKFPSLAQRERAIALASQFYKYAAKSAPHMCKLRFKGFIMPAHEIKRLPEQMMKEQSQYLARFIRGDEKISSNFVYGLRHKIRAFRLALERMDTRSKHWLQNGMVTRTRKSASPTNCLALAALADQILTLTGETRVAGIDGYYFNSHHIMKRAFPTP